jgi:hypothetical protein
MWDDADGLFFDRLILADGTALAIEVRSMVSIIPVLAAAVIDDETLRRAMQLGKQFSRLVERWDINGRTALDRLGVLQGQPGSQRLLLCTVSIDRLQRLLARLFDEEEFLSPFGLRSLSAFHREHPYRFAAAGAQSTIDYEPAESTTPMFGGNSNWRGPVWFPLNCLVISALERYHQFYGDALTFEYPARSGRLPLDAIARDLRQRLISVFLPGPDGRRPCFGRFETIQTDPRWRDNIFFHEYFNGDDGSGLGASHQTGWTAMVADAIRRVQLP